MRDSNSLQLSNNDMKIAIIGAGAIGGLVGAKLALANADVTFMMRGTSLDAISKTALR